MDRKRTAIPLVPKRGKPWLSVKVKQTRRRMRRTEEEIRDLVAGYEGGNQTRAAYCADRGLTVAALDFYRRRIRHSRPRLVEVDLAGIRLRTAAPGAVVVDRKR